VPRKYSPHHYSTSSLNQCYKAGWIHAFFTLNSDPTILTLQQKSRLNTPGNTFLIFYCPVLGSLCELLYSLSFQFLSDRSVTGVCSAAGALLLQGLTCCVFRDALLHLGCNSLFELILFFYQLNQSDHSPLTSGINKAFSPTILPLTAYFLFFGPFSVKPRDGCV